MGKEKFDYYYGIVEGRLVENGFTSIGNDQFFHNIGRRFFLITFKKEGQSSLEVFCHVPNFEQVEASQLVDMLRNEDVCCPELEIDGYIDDIIHVAKVFVQHYREGR